VQLQPLAARPNLLRNRTSAALLGSFKGRIVSICLGRFQDFVLVPLGRFEIHDLLHVIQSGYAGGKLRRSGHSLVPGPRRLLFVS
jgi:hypothetical protein